MLQRGEYYPVQIPPVKSVVEANMGAVAFKQDRGSGWHKAAYIVAGWPNPCS